MMNDSVNTNQASLLRTAFVACCLFVSLGDSAWAAGLPARVDFNYHIKPLLSDRCYTCHGPDEKARKGKLRLDTEEGAFKALDDGMAVIKPGDAAHSELVRRITTNDEDDLMPPAKSNLKLTAEEIALLKRWVEQGAEWKKHWAFIPVDEVPVPEVKNRKWPRNDIDRFVLARLDDANLEPSPEATRERLLRRVSFDLTGLPPSLAEIDAFLADRSPDAFERVVDRLLASPAYGERMAVEWLDVARYADTYGYQADRFNHLWPWRDWVISAFNRNLPFNEFILWQIAGDLLDNATQEQKLATAFNRLHRQTNEGGSVNEEFRVEYNADRVHTTAGAFLGLTMECARCHDHKYDPISQKNYYQLFAFFNSTEESGLYSHFTDAIPSPTVMLYKDDAEKQKHHELKQTIIAKEQALLGYGASATAAFEKWLAETKELPPVSGMIAHYSFDEVTKNATANLLGTNHTAKLSDSPKSVEGKFGQALQFDGEDAVKIDKFADFKRTDPFSFSLWLKIAEELPEIVVLHHQQAGSDSGFQGYQLVLEDGHASFALIHFWPGNAIKIRTPEKLKLHEWLQVGITYDGSSRAAGLNLFLNGQPVATEVVKDHLFKDFANGQPLALAARFRSRGFKDGLIDELKVFDRCLTTLEMTAIAGVQARPHPGPPGVRPSPGAETSELPTRPDIAQAIEASKLAAPEDGRTPTQGEGEPILKSATKDDLFSYYLANIDDDFSKQLAELKKLRDQENKLANSVKEIMGMGDLHTPRPTYVLKRGAYDAHGDTVEPATPESILPLDPKLPHNRLGLAKWLTDPQNPLVSRVLVNRYWQLFFGTGLVTTTDDFGSQGALPTHPELLDWLAKRFMEPVAPVEGSIVEKGGSSTLQPFNSSTGLDWNLKALCKLIVTSATYRQSSQASPDLLARDPDNKLLARGPKNRLAAEMLRDGALAASGLLVQKIGGPSVKPYQPEGIWEDTAGSKYEPDKGDALHRRSLYTFWKRTAPHPMMTTFDASERNNCTVRRQVTSTPLQALVLLNDPQFTEAARRIGERAMKEGGANLSDRITFTFRLLTGRKPSSRELAVLRKLYDEQLALFRAQKENSEALAKVGESPADKSLDTAEVAASTALASAILNFDEAILKR